MHIPTKKGQNWNHVWTWIKEEGREHEASDRTFRDVILSQESKPTSTLRTDTGINS